MKTLRSLLLLALPLIILSGCMTDSSENQDTAKSDSATSNPVAEPAPPSEISAATLPYVVKYDDATGLFEIIENPTAGAAPSNSEQIVMALKNKYPEIDLRAGALKGDTLEVEITNATYLTQSIGSAGANAFLAEATYGFTSIDSVNVVNFMFEPGDHALPGPYDRKYFDDFH